MRGGAATTTSTTTTTPKGMEALSTKQVFQTGGCNSMSSCLAWAPPCPKHGSMDDQGEVAFGVHHAVAVCGASGEMKHRLMGHTGKVTSVTWLPAPSSSSSSLLLPLLISSSEDGTVRVWGWSTEGDWRCLQVLQPSLAQPPTSGPGKPSPVTAVACTNTPAHGSLLAAIMLKGVTLWRSRPPGQEQGHEGEKWEEVWAAPMPPTQIPTSVSVLSLPGGGEEVVAVVLVGAVDARVHVWSGIIPPSSSPVALTKAGVLSGHQDWVRTLDWTHVGNSPSTVMVASGSQDAKIRLWLIEPATKPLRDEEVKGVEGVEVPQEDEDEDGDDEARGATLAQLEEEESHEVRMVLGGKQGVRYTVSLDALLIGHEEWVTGIKWCPVRRGSPLPVLLSSSMDRSMMLWRPEGVHGVWTPFVRLGELGGDIGGPIAGNLLGFMGCAFNRQGTSFVGHGYGAGAFHRWDLQLPEVEEGQGGDQEGVGEGLESWRPALFSSGHFAEVTDLSWDPHGGRYLVTVSRDQTCRLYAPALSTGRYHEMSRPQVHGYDLTCVALLPKLEHEHRLVSGADEKTLRVFDATNKALALLQDLCGCRLRAPARAETAYAPALGLSNKAVSLRSEEGEEGEEGLSAEEKRRGQLGDDDGEAIYRARTKVTWDRPPLEGELVDHTMWPEVAKLFGHLNGVTCLAVSRAGDVLATACKAREPLAACVRLWDTATWRGLGSPLAGHQSTVVQMEFTHDGSLLATVSKDRQVCLFGRKADGGGEFSLVQTLAKAHKRIIWTCSWSHDDAFLATGSRDGAIKASRLVREAGATPRLQPVSTFSPRAVSSGEVTGDAASVTAVAFAPRFGGGGGEPCYLLAVGLEAGLIELWAGAGGEGWWCAYSLPPALCHCAAVRRLRWRPVGDDGEETEGGLCLASGGSDHVARVTSVLGF